MPSHLLQPCGYSHRGTFRSDRSTDRSDLIERLSGKITIHSLLRQRTSESSVLSDQRPDTSSFDNSPTLQGTMVGRVVLQMDQAAPANKSVLRTFGERRKDADLDRSMYICAHGHSQKEVEARNESLHNFTGNKHDVV